MEKIQFIQTSPEQLQEAILNGVTVQLEQLSKKFQPKTPTEYLTRKDVSQLLKINLSTLHNWTKEEKLIAYTIGNRVYYKRSEVEQALTPLNR